MADIVVQCPVTRAFFMSTQYAMPFGAVGAVYAWDRVADLITTILSTLLLLPLSRFCRRHILLRPQGRGLAMPFVDEGDCPFVRFCPRRSPLV